VICGGRLLAESSQWVPLNQAEVMRARIKAKRRQLVELNLEANAPADATRWALIKMLDDIAAPVDPDEEVRR
jgi:hypothetical protein